MLTKLEKIIRDANPSYHIEYEELSMMNVKADEIKYSEPFVYIEEFKQGEYGKAGYYNQKTTRVELWFCKFCQMQNDAREREAIRNTIENEIVLPFISGYKKQASLVQPQTWKWFTPPPRFDANEVSVILQFDYKEIIC
ncbi:MAG: hypothetical protein LBI60_04535 [Bacteroidales bacterium]|jgi:hypothetical protein|nr:hypothetical protein [Bacteroidales bacterium]